jgi:hypothetical protein
MASREQDQLLDASIDKRIRLDNQRGVLQLFECREGRRKVCFDGDRQRLELLCPALPLL